MPDLTDRILQIYIWSCLIALVLYLPRICCYFFAFKKPTKFINDHKNKLAVIVPAKNESAVIGQCLESLANQTYDSEMFDTHVVVEDADDPSASIATAFDRTHVHFVPNQLCKGEALDGALKAILRDDPDKYDAFVIVDADNVAEPGMLSEMNNALASGKQIVCGKKLIKNWMTTRRHHRSFFSNCTALTYTQVDELGNRAWNVFGAAITMIGTGMMVRTDVIKQIDGWPYRGLTEDYEMTGDAILNGWSSMYYPFARVFTEEANDARTAFVRRLRWVKGYSQCQRHYAAPIFKKVFARQIPWWNSLFIIGTYPAYAFFAISAVAILFGLFDVVISLATGSPGIGPALRMLLMPLGLVYGALLLFTLISVVAEWPNMKITPFEKAMVLLVGPGYLLGYSRIFLTSFFTGDDSIPWVPTDRKRLDSGHTG